MSNCTSRKEDWLRWLNALIGRYGPDEKRRHENAIINYFLTIGHTGKNIIVEEMRRLGFTVNGTGC
jgi:archaellum component FlaD/FlaE